MPKVSIVILNWNGKKFLSPCLSSLAKLSYPSIEIIVVDNNSSDGSVAYIRKKFPKVIVIASKENNGFAKGNNIGAKIATGDYLLFLNNDTKVSPAFLKKLVSVCEKDPTIGCVQPEMRVMAHPELLDEAGGYLTQTGFLYHYGYRKKRTLSMYRHPRMVFSAKGACMLIPRRVLKKTGIFDEDFFIFYEETDLCYRIWLAGYSVVYVPDAFIYHVAGGDTSDTYKYERRIYLTFKNMNCSYLKNFGMRSFITIYPLFIGFQIGLFFYFLVTLKLHALRGLVRGWWWNVKNLSETLKKRRYVQQNIRAISDKELHDNALHNPGWSYYYWLFFDAQRYRDIKLPSYG